MTERRTISKSSAREDERVPADGNTPRVSDTLVRTGHAPDADLHPEAAADAGTDSKAGALNGNGGGIEPLKQRR